MFKLPADTPMTNVRADEANDIAMLLFDFKTVQDMQKEWSNSI